MSADQDFIPESGDPKLAALVKEMFSTEVGKLRKAVLTPYQAMTYSVALAFADMYEIPELRELADMLAETTVSVKGKGLNQMVEIMSARMQADGDDGMNRIRRTMGL